MDPHTVLSSTPTVLNTSSSTTTSTRAAAAAPQHSAHTNGVQLQQRNNNSNSRIVVTLTSSGSATNTPPPAPPPTHLSMATANTNPLEMSEATGAVTSAASAKAASPLPAAPSAMPHLCRSPKINVKPIAKLMVPGNPGPPPPAGTCPTSTATAATGAAAASVLMKQPPPLHINLPPHHPQYQSQQQQFNHHPHHHHHHHQSSLPSSSHGSSAKDANDMRKKRRCTDRYDSSESSDSGVATLSCTDSSATSSDGSDPGSPYSSSSSDDQNPIAGSKAQQQGSTAAIVPEVATIRTTGSRTSTSTSTLITGIHATTTTTTTTSTSSTLPHVWPWSNQFTITTTQPSTTSATAAATATVVTSTPAQLAAPPPSPSVVVVKSPQSSTSPPPLVKGGQKRNSPSTFNDATATIKKIRGTNSKPLALVAAAPKLKTIAAAAPTSAAASLITVGGNPQTKITGFFKSQMKPVHAIKRGGDLTNLVVRSTDFPKHLQAAKALAAGQLTHSANIHQVMCDIELRTAHVATTNAEAKKVERKTAKVAPLAPISRKPVGSAVSAAAAPVSRKPVSIAPRLELAKTITAASMHGIRAPAPPQQMVAPMQQQQQTVSMVSSMTPPALVSTLHKPGKHPPQYGSSAPLPTVSTVVSQCALPPPPPSLMPKLVQIPNIVQQQPAQHMHRVNPAPIVRTQQQQQHQLNAATDPAAHYFLNGALIKFAPTPNHVAMSANAAHPTKSFSLQPAQQFNHQQLYMTTSTGLLLATSAPNGIPTMISNLQMPALHPYASPVTAQPQVQPQQSQHSQHSATTTVGMILHNGQAIAQPQPQQQQPVQTQFTGVASTGGAMQLQQALQQQLNQMSLTLQPQHYASVTVGLAAAAAVTTTTAQQPLHQHQQQDQQQSPVSTIVQPAKAQPMQPQLYFANSGNSNALQCPANSSASGPTQSLIANQIAAKRTVMSSPPPLICTSTPPPLCISKPFVHSQSATVAQQQRQPKCSITITTPPQHLHPSTTTRVVTNKPDARKLLASPTVPSQMPSLTPILDAAAPTLSPTAFLTVKTPHHSPAAAKCINERLPNLVVSLDALPPPPSVTPPLLSPPPPPPCRLSRTPTPQPIAAAPTTPTPLASCVIHIPPSLPSPKSLVLERIQRLKPDISIDHCPPSPSCHYHSTPHKRTPTPSDHSPHQLHSPPLPTGAKSPILSQPKTIRFPAAAGTSRGSGVRKSDGRLVGVCYWDDCTERYDSSSKLLDHLQTQHVNAQTGPFACEWSGCKVHGRESCSRRWLERHVLSHGGTKPFKCIVDGCGLRFGSQLALQKHVNGHFNASENQKEPKDRRSSDPPLPKKLRASGKKLRYRRQPFSARMFDFFDNGIMEVLQHRLARTETTACGDHGAVVFVGQPTGRRVTQTGCVEHLVHWTPEDILPDEWLPEDSPLFTTAANTSTTTPPAQTGMLPPESSFSSACSSSDGSETSSSNGAFSLTGTSVVSTVSSSCASKTVRIRSMAASERLALRDYLRIAYKQPQTLPVAQQQQQQQSDDVRTATAPPQRNRRKTTAPKRS